MARRKNTYWDYIKVEELLALQGGAADSDDGLSNDEVRFIVVHQIDELWFKIVLRELESVRDLFEQTHVPETALAQTCAGLSRVALVFELAADHFKLMETMRTQDYLSFRDKLAPASGFQSAQSREIEILLGLDPRERVSLGHEASFIDALKDESGGSSPASARVEKRIAEGVSVKDAVYKWLYRTPINGSSPESPDDDAVVDAFLEQCEACETEMKETLVEETAATQAITEEDVARLRRRYESEMTNSRAYLRAEDIDAVEDRPRVKRMRAAILFIESNRELPLLSWPGEIIDGLIAVEQSMIIFRQRHARMVERVIGRRVGTGGSIGVDYLDQTGLQYRVFKEIWAARTLLLPPTRRPQTTQRDFYGLARKPAT